MSSARRPVIALVASAGGIEAISTVLGSLPADLPAAVLVLVHLDPDHRSRLTQIFQRASALPVRTATDGLVLDAGVVVVAPPGVHTLVTHERTVSLVRSGAFPPSRPSADLLLTSLALSVGADAVVVVMTGYGHDGATGATAVHKHGGVVLATDEDTSTHFAMPSATITRDSITPEVVPVREVAATLVAMVGGG